MNELIKKVWASGNFVVLDTETTGLRRPAEIIDIAIVNSERRVIMSLMMRPKQPISEFITGLTGITNDAVLSAFTWPQVKPDVLKAIEGKNVITYNAKFDRHMMHCSDDMWGLEQTDYHASTVWHCAMEAYAPYHGLFDDYYGSYRWARLEVAMAEQGLEFAGAHRAINDAVATYDLLAKMCRE